MEPNAKVIRLLAERHISRDDLATLTENELADFRGHVNKLANELNGEELDELLNKLEFVTCQKTKNEYWERNHCLMIQEISKYLSSYGRMPVLRELEKLTGISRQTLSKHIKEYRKSTLYQDHLLQFQFMSQKVLSKVLQIAISGDIKAARLYFEIIGERQSKESSRDNYIQINTMSISRDTFMNLPKEQLAEVEDIIFRCLKKQNERQPRNFIA